VGESTRPDRDWSQWPGRGEADDRPRRGLRALFTPSVEVADEVEALIDAGRLELEERAIALGDAISDLEEREERVRGLRATVEALLREGSAELDERHADLARAAQELADREQRLARADEELEERRTELGAVELRRAAVERREEALEQRHAELERLAAELQQRIADQDERAEALERERAPVSAMATTAPVMRSDVHLLVVPGGGYRLVEADGPVPEPGAAVELGGVVYRVTRSGPSPLPGDDRRCGFVEPA
jgi:hypothetical protein